MKNSLVFLLALFILGGAVVLRAEPLPERKSGKVLILSNHRTLAGDIERLGDRFRIRRPVGELWIPVDQTLHLGKDWHDAFGFMAGQANLLDPDERVRLAKWCQANGLHDLALKEIQFALELRPKDAQARQLKVAIEQQARFSERRSEPVQAVTYAAPPASLDVGVKSMAMFASRVQPILMNTCVSCHIAEKNTRFRLFRVTDASYRNALENNLVSALSQIDMENPELSPLLCKAVTSHGGGGKAPLNGRDTIPFLTMQAWVAQVIETNPHLRSQREPVQAREVPHMTENAPPATVRKDTETPKTAKPDDVVAGKEPTPSNAPAPRTSQPTLEPLTPRELPVVRATPLPEKRDAIPPVATSTGFASAQPQAVPSVSPPPQATSDPYHPAAFNKLMHPQHP